MNEFLQQLMMKLEQLNRVLPSCLEHAARLLIATSVFILFVWHLIELTLRLIDIGRKQDRVSDRKEMAINLPRKRHKKGKVNPQKQRKRR